ncbi:beta-N-acetylhexosaminidase [Vagococcus fessus]|uniref:Beta-N-acetylhexosaminidase n=1 Tax=Vagococcus fessus TaxID=120370 RepID=A0A430A5A7_9ENTE|nr:beta-N-acetylhexosaminidase [Vagococcus fessus]RSU01990.1 beta-N-acetylhexosaminidase [Vagococcus fessus]
MKSKEALKKRVGQLFSVGFEGQIVTDEIKTLIHDYHVGSIVLFSQNITSKSQVMGLTAALQNEAKLAGYERPLLISIDQENGVVSRMPNDVREFPGAMLLGATKEPNNAETSYYYSALELKEMGINWNLAPTLDINNNPKNPVIGVRSFGETKEQVALFGSAAIKGIQAAKVIATAKHFPGHGDTSVDSHLDLPVINTTLEQLRERELYPFEKAIEAGVETIMTAHVYFPSIEENNRPASLSKRVMQELLREELGFNGVIITDSLGMKAIADKYGVAKGAVEALKSGADMAMVSHVYQDQIEALDAVVEAVESGELDNQSIEKSIRRLSELKEKYALKTSSKEAKKLSCEELANLFSRGITVVKKTTDFPFDGEANQKALLVLPEILNLTGIEEENEKERFITSKLRDTNYCWSEETLTAENFEGLIKKSNQFDLVVIGTINLKDTSEHAVRLCKELKKHPNLVVVALRNPYDLNYLPKEIETYVTTYEFSTTAILLALEGIVGLRNLEGSLPVTVG